MDNLSNSKQRQNKTKATALTDAQKRSRRFTQWWISIRFIILATNMAGFPTLAAVDLHNDFQPPGLIGR